MNTEGKVLYGIAGVILIAAVVIGAMGVSHVEVVVMLVVPLAIVLVLIALNDERGRNKVE